MVHISLLVNIRTRITELAFGKRLTFWVVQYMVRDVYEIEEHC